MFLKLPNEMIREIGEKLSNTSDIFSLILTSRQLAHVIQPVLDKHSTDLRKAAAERYRPLIHHATALNNSSGVRLALKLDPTCINRYIPRNRTPLHVAVHNGLRRMVELLLNRGADPNVADPQLAVGSSPDTPLNWALNSVSLNQIFHIDSVQNESVVLLLLRHGANPNCPDRSNETAIIQAANIHLPHIIEAILDTGLVNINSRDQSGANALHITASESETESYTVAKMLIDAGINVNALNNAGQTALFDCWSSKTAGLLVQSGIDIGIVDYNNRTVLHYVADMIFIGKATELVSEILRSDSTIDINLVDVDGHTALDYAVYRENDPVIKLLADY